MSTDTLATASDLKAYQVMSHPLFSVGVDDSIRQLATVFVENNIGCAPVMADGKAVGVITKTDLARFESGRTSSAANSSGVAVKVELDRVGSDGNVDGAERVGRWMTPTVFSVTADTPVSDVCREMIKNGIHHLFVRDDVTDRLMGVVTTFDLLKVLSAALNRG